MPELPEVETVVLSLRQRVEHTSIKDLWIGWPGVIDLHSIDLFRGVLVGQTIHRLWRRAKYIIGQLDQGFFTIHLRMTGRLYLDPEPQGHDAWVRLSMHLSSGDHLVFSDARKFGRMQWLESLSALEAKLGPEPLDLRLPEFKARLAHSSRSIKPWLLDQSNLAGVGNIYADEALWHARIHPKKAARSISARGARLLLDSIKGVLTSAIRHEGSTIGWYRKPDGTAGSNQDQFVVYGRQNDPCMRCQRTITKIALAQRGTHFCPSCQKL
ncbi:MAG: DNA-formamidopyrimidine glycosylase [Acidobacteria bacterium]|nr:DNA-formamidopyrimidine glycosylase [Acidobacteriota bacterium]